ncbi:MAG: twin-arginine translocase TatA/TatE family subunit [Thaumarchaeota archaeon]|nr:twin-arginine translocase TatA/TatE family subunit [Nitrososphaerota archaeon]
MAWDDPVVWILIIAAVVFLFGASRIPQFARSLGQARREFEKGSKGEPAGNQPASSTSVASAPSPDDPLVVAAQKEGIDTQGKTKEQIASELSWKLNKK